MELTINGEKVSISADELTISGLLQTQNVDMPDMVSVELNGEILDRSTFDAQQVVSGDQVEFLYFMGGGH
jgi:sulfur carrier protein